MPAGQGRPYGGAVRSRLTDLGVAVIPCALGLVGPGSYDVGWSLALGAGIGTSLYWRRRSPFAPCFDEFARNVAGDFERFGHGPALCDEAGQFVGGSQKDALRQFFNLNPDREFHTSRS